MQVFNIFPLHISQLETCKKNYENGKGIQTTQNIFSCVFSSIKNYAIAMF